MIPEDTRGIRYWGTTLCGPHVYLWVSLLSTGKERLNLSLLLLQRERGESLMRSEQKLQEMQGWGESERE